MIESGLRVKDVMTRDVIYVTLPGTRDEVLEIFKKHGISGVPVVKDKRLVGIITRTDILRKPEEEQLALLMTRNPITISPEESIESAAKILYERRIRRLPVVKNDELVGIVSIADLIRALGDMDVQETIDRYLEDGTMICWEMTPLNIVAMMMQMGNINAMPVVNDNGELVGIIGDDDILKASMIEDRVEKSDMSTAHDEDAWAWEGVRDTLRLYYGVSEIKIPKIPVKEVMVKNVVTAYQYSEVSECARKMSRGNFDQLPVITSENVIIGVLKDRDLLKVFFE